MCFKAKPRVHCFSDRYFHETRIFTEEIKESKEFRELPN